MVCKKTVCGIGLVDRIWLIADPNRHLKFIFDKRASVSFVISPFLNMANSKSALKYIRKTETRTQANRQVKSRLKTLAKQVKVAAVAQDKAAIGEKTRLYISALDKAGKAGLVHKNKIARHKAACAELNA